MTDRPRHQNKDIERVLRLAERHGGWRVEVKKGYWWLRCDCPEEHQLTVKSTPSNRNYPKRLEQRLRKKECW